MRCSTGRCGMSFAEALGGTTPGILHQFLPGFFAGVQSWRFLSLICTWSVFHVPQSLMSEASVTTLVTVSYSVILGTQLGHLWHRWQSWYFAKVCDSGFGSCLSFVLSLRQSLCKTRLAYTLDATASASWVAGIKAPPQLNCVVLSSITSPDFVDSPIK